MSNPQTKCEYIVSLTNFLAKEYITDDASLLPKKRAIKIL